MISNNMNRLKTIPILVTVILSSVACSEWTEPQSIEIHVPTLKNDSPELYQAYMQSLRDYKSSEHKIMITKFENQSTAPKGQGEHLISIPDSVDYVILNNPDNLSEMIVSEMKELINDRGTKTLYTISYDKMESGYVSYKEAWELAHGETSGAEVQGEVMKTFNEYMSDSTDMALSLISKYGYHGINIELNSSSPLSMTEEEKSLAKASHEIFFGKINAWHDANPEASLLFEGAPQNVLVPDILKKVKYITVPALSANSADRLSYEISFASHADIPMDRFIIGVTAVSLYNKDDERGYFVTLDEEGNRVRAIVGAAEWVLLEDPDYIKSGIMVSNAQFDYYNFKKVYSNIREAIQIMNPSF